MKTPMESVRTPNLYRNAVRLWILVAELTLAVSRPATGAEPNYLAAGELGAIGAGSLSVLAAGHYLNQWDSTHRSLWPQPLPGERSLQRWLGGEYYPDKSNFLDGNFGSALTPAIGGTIVGVCDLQWPRAGRGKDVGQDVFLYISGIVATKGATSVVKGLVARPRPMVALAPDAMSVRQDQDFRYDRQSFFSGHASSAFFAMTFANKRVRDVMRRELRADSYRSWRWVSPVVAYGWATFVGWSRIHSYKHFISDVAVGALAGWGLAELFYAFGDESYTDPDDSSPTTFFLRFQFPLK